MAKKNKYQQVADNIIDLMGGKSNVSYFTHCVTRLRFTVKDKGLVMVDDIEALSGVVGSQWAGDQYQVIIGQAVDDAYRLICEQYGFEREDAVGEDLDGIGRRKVFSFNALLDAFSGSFAPLIPVITAAGLLKVIVMLCEMAGVLSTDSPTHIILTLAGDAGFYFLPVFIGATSARKFNASIGLGMLVGATLIHPDFIAAVNEDAALSFLGLPVLSMKYTSTVIPTIMCVYVMSRIERFIAKHSPEFIRAVAVPLFTMLIMLPVSLCLVAPIGGMVGNLVSDGVVFLNGQAAIVVQPLFCALFPLMVVTGIKSAFTPYLLNAYATVGYEAMQTNGFMISNINVGAASFIVALKSKTAALKSTAFSCGLTAVVGGITEPALYGIIMKRKTTLYSLMIGNFCGGLVAALAGVKCFVLPGSGALLGIPCYFGDPLSNIIWICVAIAVGFAATLVATYVLYKPEGAEREGELNTATTALIG